MALYTITADEILAAPFIHHPGPRRDPLQVTITGSFGGGTVNIQKKLPDNTWETIPGASYTIPSAVNIELKERASIRYEVTGSTTPSLKIEFF